MPSPIEMMIDKVTGYDPAAAKLTSPTTTRNREAETQALADALLAVADAAKRWHRARPHNRAAREKALHDATQVWIEAGG